MRTLPSAEATRPRVIRHVGGLGATPLAWTLDHYDAVMPSLRAYERFGRFLVNGWMQPDVVRILRVLSKHQGSLSVDGHVVEIGVHHGKLFIPLQLVSSPEAKSLAIDVFDDQDLNVDQSGRGNHGRFVQNVARWGRPEALVVRQADSTTVTPAQIAEDTGGPIRFFSVDGGHTREIVRSDMALAASSIVPGGVIIADDVFNDQWPGVIQGTLDFLDTTHDVVPFAIGFNKVFFTTSEFASRYIEALASSAERERGWDSKQGVFASHAVFIVFRRPRNLRGLAARIPLARGIYRRLTASA